MASSVYVLVLVWVLRFVAPFMGIRMCERQCRIFKDCNAVKFDPVYLRCTRLSTVAPNLDSRNVRMVNKDPETESAMKKCRKIEIFVQNKRGQRVCLQEKEKEDDSKFHNSKLLLLPLFSKSMEGFEINPRTNTIRKYELRWQFVRAAAFYKSEVILVFKVGIMTGSFVTHKTSFITKGEGYNDMRLDEESALVFLLRIKTGNSVSRISVMEQRWKLLFISPGGTQLGIELDKKRKTVFISNDIYILSFSYEGKQTDSIRCAKTIKAFACDPADGTLYWSSGQMLLMAKNHRVTTFKDLKFFFKGTSDVLAMQIYSDVLAMQIYSDVLYMYDGGEQAIHSLRISDKGMTTFPLNSSVSSRFFFAGM